MSHLSRAIVAFGAGLAIIAGAFASSGSQASPSQTTGRLLVDGTRAQVQVIADREGWRVLRCTPQLAFCVVEPSPAGAGRPRPLPSDVRVESERVYHAFDADTTAGALSPAATCTLRQWQHRALDTATAWQRTRGAGMRIAIVDTGIGPHPDTPVLIGRSFTHDDNNTSPNDDNGHGTHVAGVASGKPNSVECAAGIAYEADLISAKALSANGSGDTSWISEAIVWAVDNGADVINLSLGGSSGSLVMQRALQYAVSRGAVPVCAAGNDGTSVRNYPAAYPECLSVAATDADDGLASFSTWGSWVMIGSPGVFVYSTCRGGGGGYCIMNGTSMAAPSVAGVVALLMALGVPADAARVLTQMNTDPLRFTNTRRLATGAGRVSAKRAVGWLGTVSPPPTPATATPSPSATSSPTRTPTRTPTARPTATALPVGETCVTMVYIGQEPGTLYAKYIMRPCR